MINSLVSVIIPCFNHSKLLHRAINSVLNQKFLHEIVIIDDCSTDDSFAVAEELCAIDDRIALFRNATNGGPAKSRNRGALFSTGHYLAFLDADDEYLPNFLQLTVDALESNDEIKAVKTGVEFVDQNGINLFNHGDPRLSALEFSCSSNILISSESFREIGGYPEDNSFRKDHGGEDVAFNQALAKYLAPLGRVYDIAYRCWNSQNSHLDKFLLNTIVDGDTFRFLTLSEDQQPGGALEIAIERYMNTVEARMTKIAQIKEKLQ